jgi:hypothetical protein
MGQPRQFEPLWHNGLHPLLVKADDETRVSFLEFSLSLKDGDAYS